MQTQIVTYVLMVLLTIIGGKLGIDFNNADSLADFLSKHLGELLGGGSVATALAALIQRLKNQINPAALQTALERGEVDLSTLGGYAQQRLTAVAGTVTERMQTAAADAAFVTLFHHCEFDGELTDAVNTAHGIYRAKRAQRAKQSS